MRWLDGITESMGMSLSLSRLQEFEFEQALGVGDGQGSLACSSPWGCKESDTTEVTEQQHRLNSERCTLHLLQEIHYPQQLNQ